jgi:hypothetical protein
MGRLEQMMFTVPPSLLKFISTDLDKPMRLNAARGTLPLPPKDLVVAVFALTRDGDEEIKSTAAKTLLAMPAAILKTVLSDPGTHPLILDFFARNLPSDSELHETITLNKSTDDETVAFQARLTNKRLIEIISNNQIRMLRSPFIIDSLSENPMTSASILDRIVKFMELETRRKPEAAKPAVGEGMEVEIEEVTEEPAEAEELETVTLEGEQVENAWKQMTFQAELLTDKKFQNEKEQAEEEMSLSRKIQNMSVAEKIKLALLGNQSARSILVRDANKLVCSAVLKSPRITEAEIEALSKNKSVSEEVIRTISHSKEWTRNYNIKVNLVNNVKTPVGEALKFLNHLHDKDLAQLAKSKSVSQPVVVAARKLIETRQEASKIKKVKH